MSLPTPTPGSGDFDVVLSVRMDGWMSQIISTLFIPFKVTLRGQMSCFCCIKIKVYTLSPSDSVSVDVHVHV